MSLIKSLAQQLLHIDELGLPSALIDALEDVAKKTRENMSEKVADFLHNLDENQHTEQQVKGIVDLFPESLSQVDRYGRLPIESAFNQLNRVSFIPLLAKEGNLYNVGGEGFRGGLLLTSPVEEVNLIQRLSSLSSLVNNDGDACDDTVDRKALEVLDRLKGMNLLCKADIGKHDLLSMAAHPSRQQRFEFFADWDPDALKIAKIMNTPIMNTVANINTPEAKKGFEMILKTSVKHFPDDLGLLFQKHDYKAACKTAFETYGQRETMEIIRRCIPPTLPVLHTVHAHTPQYMDVFSSYYPDAMYMRDSSKRTLFQSILASGKKKFTYNATFFLQASDVQLSEKDPVTKLFPFALAASGNTSDLTAVYILLRREPNLIWCTKARRKTHRQKRKRGSK